MNDEEVECISCDAVFTPRPMHPAVTSAHCDECLTILRPLWWIRMHGDLQPAGEAMRAIRSDEV